MSTGIALGDISRATLEIKDDLSAYWNGLSAAISESSGVIADAASATADD